MSITAALIGTGSGVVSNLLDFGAKKAQIREARRAQARAQEQRNLGYQKLTGMYEPQLATSEADEARYRQAILSGEYDIPEMGEFVYNKDVNSFLNPSMDYEIDQGNRALTNSAFGKGIGKSGATLRALQEHGMDVARTGYDNAYTRMTQDRAFSYQDYLNKYSAAVDQIRNRQSSIRELAGKADYTRGQLAGITSNYYNGNANSELAKGNINAINAGAGWQLGADMVNTLGTGGANIMGQMSFGNKQALQQPMQQPFEANPVNYAGMASKLWGIG